MVYQVKLTVFEGPLDLLLHLIEKRELDIAAVSLAQVTDQYLEYLTRIDEINPDSLADFVAIAAKLLVIKSFALLPSRTPSAEEEDIAADLTTALVEFRLFKRASEELRAMEEAGWRAYARSAKPVLPPPAPVFGTMTATDLLEALIRLGHQAQESDQTVRIPQRIYKVSDKIELIQRALAMRPRVAFGSLISRATSRLEVIVTFLAMLELVKKGRVEVEQTERYGEIYLFHPSPIPEAT